MQFRAGGVLFLNIQIYRNTRCFNTKKAEPYFKERGIKYQFVDILRFGISPGEYKSVKAALGGKLDFMIDESSKEYDKCFIKYLSGEEAIEEKVMENPGLFKTPIVRNGKQATIGYVPEIWSNWK